jgi:signal transduction histidine kinase
MRVDEQLRSGARQESTRGSKQHRSGDLSAGSMRENQAAKSSGDMTSDWLHLCELLETFVSIGRLGVGIAHNLNGSLAGIIGHAEVMKMKRPELSPELDTILGLARKLRDGIAEISTKLDNELTREAQPQNINQILRATISFLKADLYFKHYVKVELALQEPLPNVYGFYADFSLALEDLLLNAIDAQREISSGWIRIQTSTEGDRVHVTIENAGSGFSEEALASLFQPLPSEVILNEDRSIRGHVGLALAKSRLERWGGTIAVGNRDEGGARIMLTLPRREKVPSR